MSAQARESSAKSAVAEADTRPAGRAVRPLLEGDKFHLAVGVDHFFIFDNGSEDDVAAVLTPYIAHGLVTLLHWPLPGGQIDAYTRALRFCGNATERMAFIDADEFIVRSHAMATTLL